MPRIVALVIVAALSVVPACETKQSQQAPPASGGPAVKGQTVEAGCATCIFKMEGVTGCKLAVRIDGKPYLVSGSDLDAHGDAHGPQGMCVTARQARVEGKIEGDRFVATKFELLP